jgi:hypothetical protein
MTLGQKKLKEVFDKLGYKQMTIDTGISKTSIYNYALGRVDCTFMTLKLAIELENAYGIDLDDWEVEVEE